MVHQYTLKTNRTMTPTNLEHAGTKDLMPFKRLTEQPRKLPSCQAQLRSSGNNPNNPNIRVTRTSTLLSHRR